MDIAAFTTTLTSVGGHILDPVWGFTSNPEIYTAVYSEVTSLKHNVASSTGFFLHLLVAVLLYKNMHSYPCQPTYTVYIRTLIYVHSVLFCQAAVL